MIQQSTHLHKKLEVQGSIPISGYVHTDKCIESLMQSEIPSVCDLMVSKPQTVISSDKRDIFKTKQLPLLPHILVLLYS